MINTLRQSFQIGAAVTGNTLIYWCQRLPLVGKLFKDRLYAEGSLKDGVCAVAFLLKACTQVLYKALYVCLAIWLPAARSSTSSEASGMVSGTRGTGVMSEEEATDTAPRRS